MDNPQETKKMNKDPVKWLAGFFDAEGSVSFNYKPNIDIVNTCPMTSYKVKEILTSLGIKVGIHYREKTSKSSKKPRWDIFLRQNEQVYLFIEKVGPYVYGKKLQLEIAKEWFRTKTFNTKEKIIFANQLNNIVVTRIQKIKDKLKTNDLYKYPEIQILTDTDGFINNYEGYSDLNYIAGLIDGDGCFNIHRRHSLGGSRYTPQILFINTNKEIIKRYCSVLKNSNIGFHISFRTAGQTTNRRRWDIVVSGVKRTVNLCSLIQDFLETKREQCKLLLEYSKHRLLYPKSLNNDLGFETKNALQGMRSGKY